MDFDEFTFDPDKHEYTLDGRVVPSVTQVVAPLGADYDDMDEFTERAVDVATERGVVLHDYIAAKLLGADREDFEMPTDFEEYADAVDAFFAEHDIDPYLVEHPMTDGVYAGTPDIICEYNGVLAVLDYKFVSNISKSRVCAQLGGYKALCEANNLYPEELYAIQFTRGDYRVYPVDPETAARMWRAATALWHEKTLKHFRGKIGEWN